MPSTISSMKGWFSPSPITRITGSVPEARRTTLPSSPSRFSTLATAANIGVGAYLPSWAGTTTVVFRLSGTGNLGNGTVTNLNAGSVTFYLVTDVMP